MIPDVAGFGPAPAMEEYQYVIINRPLNPPANRAFSRTNINELQHSLGGFLKRIDRISARARTHLRARKRT
jgi:hypothetical protein